MVSCLPIWMVCLTLLLAGALCAAPRFEESEVFVGGQDNTNTYRIPSLACTARGTVLAFCEGRKDNNIDGSPTDLVLKRSLGNAGPWTPAPPQGRSSVNRSRTWNLMWQPMQTVLASKDREAFMNPVPIIDRTDGTLLLLVNYHPVYEAGKADTVGSHIWLLTSTDEGATWSKPRDITEGVGTHELGPGLGIQMRTGRMVAPVYDGVIFSDDRGRTWKAGAKAPGPVSESQVVELQDGSLLLNTRGYPNRTVVLSKDGGETWGDPHADPALTDPELWNGCQASLLRYPSKDSTGAGPLLYSAPADPRHRFDLTVRVSYDDGKTWPVARLIKKGTASYSCLTVFPDGSIGLIYETGNAFGDAAEYYAKLSFARFNREWLEQSG